MKNIVYITTLITTLITSTVFVACQSADKKVDKAEVNLQDAKKDLSEAQKNAEMEAIKATEMAEWKTFRAESEVKISENEARIKELRGRKNAKGKMMDAAYTANIELLEKKNMAMREQMDVYENNHGDWASFKREFNHDMAELGQALNDLAVDNKK